LINHLNKIFFDPNKPNIADLYLIGSIIINTINWKSIFKKVTSIFYLDYYYETGKSNLLIK